MSQAGIINVIDNNPEIPIIFDADTGSATAIMNILNVFGSGGIVTSASGNTITIDGSALTDLYVSPYIVDAAGGPGSSFTTIQAAVTQAIADGATSTARNILIRPGTYTETFSITTANVKLNFIGIGGTYPVTNSFMPALNGTLTINASSSYITFSNFYVATLALTDCLICMVSGALFNSVSRSAGSFYANSSRFVSYSQSNNDTAQFYNCNINTIATASAGQIFFYGGICLTLTVSGSVSVVASNCFLNTSGTTSGTVTLNSCSGGSTLLQASPIVQGGSQQGNFLVTRSVSSSGSTSAGDYVIEVDSSGGPITLTVPVGTNLKGYSFIVKDVGGAASINNITITPTGKTIDNVASKIISSAYGSLTIYYNGTNFFTL